MRRLVVLGLLALGACASASGPSFVPNPQAGIELRWANGQGTIEAAQAAAAARCGGAATLAGEWIDQDETLARFYCAG
jgi:hypothetical protein